MTSSLYFMRYGIYCVWVMKYRASSACTLFIWMIVWSRRSSNNDYTTTGVSFAHQRFRWWLSDFLAPNHYQNEWFIGVRLRSHTNCYGKTWRLLCPFFRNLHLRENLTRDCFTSTACTVTDYVQNIFTRLRYCDKWTIATLNNNLV